MDVTQVEMKTGGLADRVHRRLQRVLSHGAAAMPRGPLVAMCQVADHLPLSPKDAYLAYTQGMFPLDSDGRVRWQSPDQRSVLLLDQLHISRRIRTYLRKGLFQVRVDTDRQAVVGMCAERDGTWLTPRLLDMYEGFEDLGVLHSVETYDGDELVGGVFGVAVGGVFCLESMFHRVNHAGTIAFATLAQMLDARGFLAIDCQYQQEHFARFGAAEVPRGEYRSVLARGLAAPPSASWDVRQTT